MTDEGRHTRLLERLERLARGVAGRMGVELVELALRGSSRKRVLRLDIDRTGPAGVNLDDCANVSEAMGEALEHDDAIPGSYLLEVSSPGVDRPIRTADDVRRNTGRRVMVRTTEPIDGRASFRGTLQGLSDGTIRLCADSGEEIRIEWPRVEKMVQDVGF